MNRKRLVVLIEGAVAVNEVVEANHVQVFFVPLPEEPSKVATHITLDECGVSMAGARRESWKALGIPEYQEPPRSIPHP